MTQEECLQTKEKESTDRILLVTTFNRHTTFIAEIARRNWNFLQSNERLARIFNSNHQEKVEKRPSNWGKMIPINNASKYHRTVDTFGKMMSPTVAAHNLVFLSCMRQISRENCENFFRDCGYQLLHVT